MNYTDSANIPIATFTSTALVQQTPCKGKSVTEHTILVYGTLRPFLNDEIIKVPGKIYDLGRYPGLILGNHQNPDECDSFVSCERIKADDKRLAELDDYEGYNPNYPEHSLYIRKKIGNDWIYVYSHSVENHTLIESGDWYSYNNELETVDVY